jgi:hypothetical protein
MLLPMVNPAAFVVLDPPENGMSGTWKAGADRRHLQ